MSDIELELVNEQAIRPVAFDTEDALHLLFLSPAHCVIPGGGKCVMMTGIQCRINPDTPAKVTFKRPDWLPKQLTMNTNFNDGEDTLVVFITNTSDVDVALSRGVFILEMIVDRSEIDAEMDEIIRQAEEREMVDAVMADEYASEEAVRDRADKLATIVHTAILTFLVVLMLALFIKVVSL